MFLANGHKLLVSLDRFLLDASLSVWPRSAADNRIVIVKITDDNYRDFFCSTSPLDVTILKQLIWKISTYHPRVIAVDLDVKLPKIANELDSELNKLQGGRPVIVWAQVGQQVEFKEPKNNKFGVPQLPLDSDGIVRGYVRCISLSEAAGCKCSSEITGCEDSGRGNDKKPDPYFPTLPWAVLHAAREVQSAGLEADEKRIFNIVKNEDDFSVLGAEQFLPEPEKFHLKPNSCRAAEVAFPIQEMQTSSEGNSLAGKIVLVGGAYEAARDRYLTPVGERTGVELIGQAIHSEMTGKGLLEFSPLRGLFIDIGLGMLLLAIGSRWFHWKYTGLLTTSLGLLLPLALCWALFRNFALWLSFAPVLVTTVIGLIHDQMKEKSRKIEILTKELQQCRATAASHDGAPLIPPPG